MAPKLQSWAFTLGQACVRQRYFHEFEWDAISMLDNAVITIKQERLLANVVGSRDQLTKEPNHVLIVPLQGRPALKLGLGSRDGNISPEFTYGVRYKQEKGTTNIKLNTHDLTKEVALQFKNRNDQDQVLRLFQDLGLRLEPSRGPLRQPSRSSTVVTNFQPPSANQPFTSRRSITPLYQYYPERLGSSLKNQFFPDESSPSSRARSVLIDDHRPMNTIGQHNGDTHQSSSSFAISNPYERARTEFSDRQGMGTHVMSSQDRQYTPAPHSASATYHKPSTFSPPPIRQNLDRDFSPPFESLLLNEIGQPRSRPSSGAAFRDMLPPRRELPFSSGKQTESTASKRSHGQPELSHLEQNSTKASQEEEVFQQLTPQTISKPLLSAEQAKKPKQTRLLVVKRKDNNVTENPATKKQKPDSSPKPVSTSPIPLPIIPSAPFKRKVIARRPGVPSNPYYPPPNRTIQKASDKLGSRSLVATPSSNETFSAETATAKEVEVADAPELPAADTSSTSSEEEEVDPDSTPAVPKPANTSVMPDGSNILPKPTSTKMDQGTQTLPDLSDTSAKDDDVFVAKFQLM